MQWLAGGSEESRRLFEIFYWIRIPVSEPLPNKLNLENVDSDVDPTWSGIQVSEYRLSVLQVRNPTKTLLDTFRDCEAISRFLWYNGHYAQWPRCTHRNAVLLQENSPDWERKLPFFKRIRAIGLNVINFGQVKDYKSFANWSQAWYQIVYFGYEFALQNAGCTRLEFFGQGLNFRLKVTSLTQAWVLYEHQRESPKTGTTETIALERLENLKLKKWPSWKSLKFGG